MFHRVALIEWFIFICGYNGFVNALSNLAVGKSAYQMDNYTDAGLGFYTTADRAVDGDTNANLLLGSCTHTATIVNAWWKVDLGKVYRLYNVVVFNRADCCTHILGDLEILISDDDSSYSKEGSHPGSISAASETFTFGASVTGRWVKITTINRALAMCEVQVFGEEVPTTPTTTTTTTPTTTTTTTPITMVTTPMSTLTTPTMTPTTATTTMMCMSTAMKTTTASTPAEAPAQCSMCNTSLIVAIASSSLVVFMIIVMQVILIMRYYYKKKYTLSITRPMTREGDIEAMPHKQAGCRVLPHNKTHGPCRTTYSNIADKHYATTNNNTVSGNSTIVTVISMQ